MEDASAALKAELEPFLNKPGARQFTAIEIEKQFVWDYCTAVEDGNPVYWDEEVAKKSRFGRLIAPPNTLMTLNRPAHWLPKEQQEKAAAIAAALPPSPQAQAREVLAKHGFTTVTVVNREEEYFEPFGPGDGRLSMEDRFVAVSDIKTTKVGPGVFFTYEIDYYTERDNRLVGRARNVTLIYNGSGATK
jgi:hypothetical protein